MSWLLSKRAVSPLVSAYEKQKEFITNASHELKTPLAIISANNDIIEIENGSSKWISSNKGQIKKLSSMIDMLVTLTKLDESAKLENASSVDIASLLNSSIEGFAPLAEAQGKSFNVSAHKGSKEDAPLTHFSFSISNYSENLKKGSYDILFDRFYRLDSSRNSETGGFGIGLSIAKVIVQKHGGEIKAFSPDGERMVFRLEI
ncbi:sensor histidine kinase [Mogibacterium sp.]